MELEIAAATRVLWLERRRDRGRVGDVRPRRPADRREAAASARGVPRPRRGPAARGRHGDADDQVPRQDAPQRRRRHLHAQEGGDWYAFTQFEATDARQAFPCFDEPSFKVPWRLTLHTTKELDAIANTPIESERDEPNGMKTVRFAETKPLPSYLVAFAVGPFDIVDAGKTRAGAPIRIVVPRGRGEGRRVPGAGDAAAARSARGLLRHPVPVREARHRRGPGVQRRRDGEPGPHHVPAGDPAHQARRGDARPAADATPASPRTRSRTSGSATTSRSRGGTTSGSTRRSRPGWRPRSSRSGSRSGTLRCDRGRAQGARDGRGQPRLGARDPPADRERQRHQQRVRRHHVPEGRGGADDVRALDRRRDVPAGRPRVPRRSTRGATPTYEDFVGAMSAAAGKDLRPVFDAFVLQSGVPLVSFELACGKGAPPVLALSPAALHADRLEDRSAAHVAGAGVRAVGRRQDDRPRLHDALGAGRASSAVGEDVPRLGAAERGRPRLLPDAAEGRPARSAARARAARC